MTYHHTNNTTIDDTTAEDVSESGLMDALSDSLVLLGA